LPTFDDATPESHTNPLVYNDLVTVNCKSGFFIDGLLGGASSFSVRCQADGSFSQAPGSCSEPRVSVSGEATDAQSGSIKLGGASVVFEKDGVQTSATADSSGRFSATIPVGLLKMTVSKDGYIKHSKNLTVAGNIYRGQGADAALSKELPPGAWRVTLDWEQNPRDVDTHVVFGSHFGTEVYYPSSRRSLTAPGTGGIRVVLDRDDVDGYGPETTTFDNVAVGGCSGNGKCLIKFQMKKYSGQGTLGDGHPIVNVYQGSQLVKTYHPDPSANIDRNKYTVFTLDARDSTLHDGSWTEGPYLQSSRYTANWWGSLDSQQWSMTATGSFLTGLYRHPNGGNNLYHLEEGRYSYVENTNEMDCQEADWSTSFDQAGWSTCPTGYFVSGLYRTGSMRDGDHGTKFISKAWCCKPKELPSEWGACSDDVIFDSTGLSSCPAGKAMAGLRRSTDGFLNGLDHAKCCELKSSLVEGWVDSNAAVIAPTQPLN
jgi:hypothetical protein